MPTAALFAKTTVAGVNRRSRRGVCRACDGTGRWKLLNSWFTADGQRVADCHACHGRGYMGIPPEGFTRRKDVAIPYPWPHDFGGPGR